MADMGGLLDTGVRGQVTTKEGEVRGRKDAIALAPDEQDGRFERAKVFGADEIVRAERGQERAHAGSVEALAHAPGEELAHAALASKEAIDEAERFGMAREFEGSHKARQLCGIHRSAAGGAQDHAEHACWTAKRIMNGRNPTHRVSEEDDRLVQRSIERLEEPVAERIRPRSAGGDVAEAMRGHVRGDELADVGPQSLEQGRVVDAGRAEAVEQDERRQRARAAGFEEVDRADRGWDVAARVASKPEGGKGKGIEVGEQGFLRSGSAAVQRLFRERVYHREESVVSHRQGRKSRLLRWFHGHEHTTWGTDPGCYDPESVEKTIGHVGWLFGPGRYFRLQVEGWDNVPAASRPRR